MVRFPTVGQATAALVCGVVGIVLSPLFVPSLVAVALGVVGLRKVARSGGLSPGRGMAIAGIILGLIGLPLGAGVWWALSAAERQLSIGDPVGAHRRGAPGECADFTSEGAPTLQYYRVTDCSSPHRGEVYVAEPLPAGPYDQARVNIAAGQMCREAYESYVGVPSYESRYEFQVIYPGPQRWSAGDREVTCLVVQPSSSSERQLPPGSLRGSGA